MSEVVRIHRGICESHPSVGLSALCENGLIQISRCGYKARSVVLIDCSEGVPMVG